MSSIQDKKASHSKPWNPSIKFERKSLNFEPFEPNPNGKAFDCGNRDIWPVLEGRTNGTKQKIKTPWYSVRQGELFNRIDQHSPLRTDDGKLSQAAEAHSKLEKAEPFYVYVKPGSLFSSVEFSPTFSKSHLRFKQHIQLVHFQITGVLTISNPNAYNTAADS